MVYASGLDLSEGLSPNALWRTNYKGEFMLGDKRYCYPLTVSDYAARSPVGSGSRLGDTLAFAKPAACQSQCQQYRTNRCPALLQDALKAETSRRGGAPYIREYSRVNYGGLS